MERAETPEVLPPPLFGLALLCRSSCGPFGDLFLDQALDQTPIALCESEFVCQTSFQKYADAVMA